MSALSSLFSFFFLAWERGEGSPTPVGEEAADVGMGGGRRERPTGEGGEAAGLVNGSSHRPTGHGHHRRREGCYSACGAR